MRISPSSLDTYLQNRGIKYKSHRRQFIEAYRRFFFVNKNNENLSKTWLGLGYPSQYKGPYFRTHDRKTTPRILHWWVLTASGREVFEQFIKDCPPPKKRKYWGELNDALFNF